MMTPLPPELLSPAEMGRADEAAVAGGTPGIALMENAGWAATRAIRRRFAPCRTLVLCGPGNNGGDGYVVARRLAEAGWPVVVAASAPPRPGTDAALAAARFCGPHVACSPAIAGRAALVVDALFGAGLARPLDGLAVDVLRAARRLVAIDVPSGLDGATGIPLGFAPQAALTVTFFRRKPGHLLLPGRLLSGELVLADIGIPESMLGGVHSRTFANGPALWRLPSPDAASHKYSRGHLTILGGEAMTGAARLAAAAARRAGAGMVTIAAPANVANVYRAGDPGIIVTEAPLADLLADSRRQAWICGPGLGQTRARTLLPELLAARRAVVVDADALTAFAGEPDRLRDAAILTPHVGEFSRLFGPLATDRLAATREAARRTGAVVVLKGADSIIAAPDGWAAINDNAPPTLATAGTGDVLAGIIGGLLAQGLAPVDAAAAGVFLHGAAAHCAGPGLIAEDLVPAIPHAVAAISRGEE